MNTKLLSIQWFPCAPSISVHWTIRVWMYHRLANASRLQIGRLVLTWVMPWSKVCYGQPGYGDRETRWSPVRQAFGLSSRERVSQ